MNKIAVLAFIWLPVLIWSCSKNDDSPMEMEVIEPVEYTYLALGDSYTIGQGVAGDQRWPNQLSERLQEDTTIIITDVNIIAQTGWTTNNLLSAIEAVAPVNHDFVSLLIGVNNQFQGLPFDVFQVEFDSLLNIAATLADGKENVFVVSIPDYGVTPFGISNSQQIAEELDNYNAYIEERCVAEGVVFVNITEISRTLGAGENALAPDNLHPSGFQYGQWVELILPEVITLLKE